jgi:hypothetical protein
MDLFCFRQQPRPGIFDAGTMLKTGSLAIKRTNKKQHIEALSD